jgi:hypothetical protein
MIVEDAAAVLAFEDLVAGLAGDNEFPAKRSHLLAVEQASHEAETLVHFATLFYGTLPSRKARECNPCPRYQPSPLSQERHGTTEFA